MAKAVDIGNLPSLGHAFRGQTCLIIDTGAVYVYDGITTWYLLPTGGTLAAGSAIIGKVGIDQTTPGTTDSVSVKSGAFDVATTITRPANTTQYTAGDVLGGALDLGVLGPSAKAVKITSSQLEIDVTAIPTGMTTFTLHLYSVTPPSAVADNGVFDLPAGDRASYLGAIPIGAPADLGSTLYVEAVDLNKQVLLTGTHLFGYLVTTGGFTPAGNSEVYKLTLHTVAV